MAIKKTNFVTGDAAFAVDRNGSIVLWNSEAAKLLGFPAAKAIGLRCWKLFGGKDIHGNRYCVEFCPIREMAARHETVHGFQLSLKTASGERKKFSLTFLEVFDQNGEWFLLHICNPAGSPASTAESEQSGTDSADDIPDGLLTVRELEVLELLADGKTTDDIASLLYVSPLTVRNHIQHVLHKLCVHSRLEAVIKCQELNLI